MKKEFKDFEDLHKWCKNQMAITDRCILTGLLLIAIGLCLVLFVPIAGLAFCVLALYVIGFAGVLQRDVKKALMDWEERNV